MTEPVGLIGLGLLGGALAERLITGGWAVTGFDLDPDRRRELSERGGVAVESAEEVARRCRCLLYSLPTSEIARQVSEQILPALVPGTLVLDTTTGHPAEMESLAAMFQEAGCRYVDTNVSGSSEQARRGEVVLLVGATREQVEVSHTLLERLSPQVFYLGQPGDGVRMKLVVNLVLGLHRAVLAEGLGLAEKLGLELPLALEVLQAGPAASVVMQTKGRKMIERDFTPQARLAQHWKDVRLILELGTQHNARLPLSRLHDELLRQQVDDGAGGLDNSAIIRAFLPDTAS